MAEYFVGIDLGTSSVRAFLIDFETKRSYVAGETYDVSVPQLGYAEQNPDMWFEKTVNVIRRVLGDSGVDPREIAAVSFSGQMHGMVALDEQNRPVMDVPIWMDQRSGEAIAEIYRKLGDDMPRENLQNWIATGFLVSSLYWLKTRREDLYKRVARVILPKDYLKFRLCGRALTDPSDAAGSLAYNNARLCWAEPVIEGLGLNREIFPECLPSTEVVGHITAEAAKLTGLREGTPVVNGGSDQCMQSIGNAVVEEGVFASNIGTSAVISIPVSRPLYDEKMRTNFFAHAVPNYWSNLVACLNGGCAMKWLTQKIFPGLSYDEINAMVAPKPAGAQGLIFLPYLSGERTPHMDPKAKAVFFGLTLDHDRADMARSLMEGIVFGMKDGLNVMDELGVACKHVVAAGGGARSDVWLQMQADIFERDVHRSASKEQACLGAAITAAIGVGKFSNYPEACAACVEPPTKVFSPIEENVRVYRELFPIYRELYRANKPGFDAVSDVFQVK